MQRQCSMDTLAIVTNAIAFPGCGGIRGGFESHALRSGNRRDGMTLGDQIPASATQPLLRRRFSRLEGSNRPLLAAIGPRPISRGDSPGAGRIAFSIASRFLYRAVASEHLALSSATGGTQGSRTSVYVKAPSNCPRSTS